MTPDPLFDLGVLLLILLGPMVVVVGVGERVMGWLARED